MPRTTACIAALTLACVMALVCCGKGPVPPSKNAPASPSPGREPGPSSAAPARAAAPEICIFVAESSSVKKCGDACFDHTHTFSTTIKNKKVEWQDRIRVPGDRGWQKTNGHGCCPMTCEALARGERPQCKVRTVYGDQAVTLPSAVIEEYRRVYCPAPCGDCATNPEAARLFDLLYDGPVDPNVAFTPAEELAISRFRESCVAARLLKDLANMPCPSDWIRSPSSSGKPCTMGRYIRFKLKFQDSTRGSSVEAGHVQPGQFYPDPDPERSDAGLLKQFDYYTVSVTRETDTPPESGHAFPSPSSPCFTYTFSEGSSAMANTIYHELLHIWWMNLNQTNYDDPSGYGSGHGPNLESCDNYEPEFVRRLRDFYRTMDELEKCLKPSPSPS